MRIAKWLQTATHRQLWFFIGAVVIILLIVIASIISSGEKSTRVESYKKVSGGAGLEATITYPCEKPCFDFNVYIFKDNGQQIAVVRPDKDGRVNMAMTEGNYIMLIGKKFGKDRVFPQEPLALKNGQSLELKLHYEEETL